MMGAYNQEMYKNVNDKQFHSFLWRTDNSQQSDIYEFNRLVFPIFSPVCVTGKCQTV